MRRFLPFDVIFTLIVLFEYISPSFLLESEIKMKENSNISMIEKSNIDIIDPNVVIKIFKKNEQYYEFKSFIKNTSSSNENHLLIKVNKENSENQVYNFDGTFNQIIDFDSEWKVFKTVEQIFSKVIKIDIYEEKFNVEIQKSEMILQFIVNIIGEATPLKIRLFNYNSTQTNETCDLNILSNKIAVLEAQMEEMQNKLSNKEQELFSFVSEFTEIQNSYFQSTYIQNGNTYNFDLETKHSGEIELKFELDCFIEIENSYTHFYAISLFLVSKIDVNNKMKFNLFTQQYYFNNNPNSLNGSVLSVRDSKTIKLLKGSYTATLKFNGGKFYNTRYESKCQKLILKRIDK